MWLLWDFTKIQVQPLVSYNSLSGPQIDTLGSTLRAIKMSARRTLLEIKANK